MTVEAAGFKPTKEELSEWLDTQLLCTISTNGQGGFPNAASVAFSHNDALEFFIITSSESRKADNIGLDQRVAITVTNMDDRYTMQLEGEAKRLTWDEFAPQESHHYAKLPFSLPFKTIPDQTPYRITPTHLRFSDINVHPWELTDIIG